VDNQDGLERDELDAALHEELGRLPEKYRAPLLLCYIEGLPHEVVARQLGWPLGTVRVRIARGRDVLRGRLTRRGLAPAAVLFALGLLPKTAVAVPRRLVEATVRAAARVAVGEKVPGGDVPARVVALERKVRKAMHLTRLKWAAAFVLAGVVTGVGVVAVVPRALAAADDATTVEAELKKLQGTWLIATFEQAGTKKEATGNEEQLRIEGETFSLWHDGHLEEKGTIKLDLSRNPKAIDFQFLEGRRDGQTDPAIYTWEGANLKLCLVREGEERPTDFTTKPGEKRVVAIMRRQDP
jgi:uncharacterized protein (TIGR03067 family)